MRLKETVNFNQPLITIIKWVIIMTNKNYTILSNRQLWKEIQLLNKKSHVIKEWLRRHDIELFQEVLNRTKFIDDA